MDNDRDDMGNDRDDMSDAWNDSVNAGELTYVMSG
jgi:hypothetical protein